MKVAFWSPLPPDVSPVAEHSFALLGALRNECSVTAVIAVRADEAKVPVGVEVISAADYQPENYDVDIYCLANDLKRHGYILRQAFRRPGILMLYEPALTDLYADLVGGSNTTAFAEEAAYNVSGVGSPAIEAPDGAQADPLALLMSRDVATHSNLVFLHSPWAVQELQHRWQLDNVRYLPLATPLRAQSSRSMATSVTFGLFTDVTGSDDLDLVANSFAAIHEEFPDTVLKIARSESFYPPSILRGILDGSLSRNVVLIDLVPGGTGRAAFIESVDVLISLRWPTYGEMSADVMRAFGSGVVAITDDAPQYRSMDSGFCHRMPTEYAARRPAITEVLRRLASDPPTVRGLGRSAQEFVGEYADPGVVARQIVDLLRSVRPNPIGDSDDPKVNAIASWAATTGLAEAARRVTMSLCAAGVTVAVDDFDYGAPQSPNRIPPMIQKLPAGRPFDIDLVFLNVNELLGVPEEYLERLGHYRIGSWYWELPDFAEPVRRQINRVDEIWVASHFVRDAFLQYTDVPIRVFPAIVEPREDHSLSRENFGIDRERCVYFFNFDGNSTFARKNPWGVIDAYRSAFTSFERKNSVQLVIKTINLYRHGEGRTRLEEEMASVGALLIDQELTEREMASLVGCCDVYVSLHRAEGFGLGMAEAMYLGHPVIATAYSGNMEFTTQGNSCQVGYKMRPISHEELRFNESSKDVYRPGMLWAEPDLDQAARWMRLLYEDPLLRKRIGTAGQAFVRSQLSASTIGARMRRRLEELGQQSVRESGKFGAARRRRPPGSDQMSGSALQA